MDVTIVLQQMVIIFILVLTGAFISKLNFFSDMASKDFSTLVVNVCNPMLVVTSALTADRNISNRQLIQAGVLGLVTYLLLIVLAFLVPVIIHAPKNQRNQYNLMTIFGNIGFIGIPLITAVFGSSGVIYTVIFNIYYGLFIYTYGKSMIAQGGEENENSHFKPRDLINVGSVTSILAIVLYLASIKLPLVISESISFMGRATTFVSMVVIGISLARTPIRDTFGDKRVYLFVLVRQLLIPILLGIAMKFFIKDPLMHGVALLIICMPIGNMPLMMAEEAGTDGSVISRGIMVSTILSVITIPLVVLLVT